MVRGALGTMLRWAIALACATGAGCSAGSDAPETANATTETRSSGSSTTIGMLPIVGSGGTLRPGEPASMTVETHCGVRYLGRLNGSDWVATDPASAAMDWMPAEWSSDSSSPLRVRVELATGANTIEASFNGRTIEYEIVEQLAEEVELCA